jgi:cardiolipin synthase A/B
MLNLSHRTNGTIIFCLKRGKFSMKNYHQAELIKLVHSGNNYFDLLEEIIDDTKEVIHLQTYIFETDTTGLRIVNALLRAALRNVKVFLLLDAFGSSSFSKQMVVALKEAGVQIRFFAPFFSSENIHWGRRLHYKIIVSDRKKGLTGGINIADKYNETDMGAPWLDYAIYSEGAVCEYLHLLCDDAYAKKSHNILRHWEKSFLNAGEPGYQVRFRLNDRLRRSNEISRSFKEHILGARHSIIIIGSYFLPPSSFRKMLTLAASRGVKICLVLASESDIKTMRFAESYLYAYYLRNNIQVFEWQKSVLHGKVMIIDSEWVSVGSFNINFLSNYLSMELNTEVRERQFATEFTDHINEIIKYGCKHITPSKNESNKTSGVFRQLLMWMAYNLFRLIKNISVRRKPL